MRVYLDVAGVDHQPFKVRLIHELLQQPLPDALVAPAAKAAMRVLPVTIIGRQIAPRSAGAQNPKHCIDEAAIVVRNPAP